MDSFDDDSHERFLSGEQIGGPFARIVEQPAKCGVRFRYECEGRISGAIPGQNSTTLRPTFPTIKLFNYSGRAKVVVSCVTKNPPFRPHPHNLVGKKSCKDGVCQLVFCDGICVFNNLGILCAKRKDIRERLRVREHLRCDPFRTGFGHKSQAFKIIDLAVIRLCFQVFLEGPQEGQFDVPLDPLVSDPIFDKKAMSELSIAKLSHYSAPASGGQEIILLCDRVIKDDIQIRFFEEREDAVYWEAFADFKASDIHKHFAISFRSPKYCDVSIATPVAVNVELRRPSDGGTSESLPFYLLPRAPQDPRQRRKRGTPPAIACPVVCHEEYNVLPTITTTETTAMDFDFDMNCIQLDANELTACHELWAVGGASEGQLLDISESRANCWPSSEEFGKTFACLV
ncbi:unnamed protein product [Oppiella nova]|uniref:RHD domain-containing protein n=1 Tax=Oppiella nova TaxID=334625 RepID=A0A7R9QH10_9ACAR|nr:unnamed protein product [Oppiella nova]CAG2165771.1 unnamed protein product [Oppiella nova]